MVKTGRTKPTAINESGQENKVITLFSTTGRVGKTTIALNIAGEWSAAGLSVCIVDADLQGGDVCRYLGIEPRHTIVDFCSRGEDWGGGIDDYLANWRDNARVIPAPDHMTDAEKVNPDEIPVLLRRLRDIFGFVVVDTAAGFSETTLAALDAADLILFVCVLDYLPSVKNIVIGMNTIKDLGHMSKTHLVLSRQNARTAIAHSEVEEVLKQRFAFAFANDYPLAAQAIGQGVPFVLSHPDKELSRQSRQLAASISAGTIGTREQGFFTAAKAWFGKARPGAHSGPGM